MCIRDRALALGLLCQLSELKWSLVEGTLEGVPHCWVRLTLEEGERHLDPSAGITLYTQDQLPDLGYHWPEEPEPVSYTHLDVYKRQPSSFGPAAPDWRAGPSAYL